MPAACCHLLHIIYSIICDVLFLAVMVRYAAAYAYFFREDKALSLRLASIALSSKLRLLPLFKYLDVCSAPLLLPDQNVVLHPFLPLQSFGQYPFLCDKDGLTVSFSLQMDTYINVSSRENSPDQGAAPRAPRAPRATRTRSRQKRPLPQGDVIELTDSDSEEFSTNISQLFMSQPSRSLKKGKARAEPAAGPSRRRRESSAAAVPPPRVLHPKAGQSPQRKLSPAAPPQQPPYEVPPRQPTPQAALPLFLPDLDFPEPPQPMADFAPMLVDEQVFAPPIAPFEPYNEPHPQAPPEPQNYQDPLDAFVAQILEIIPDVLPSHVYSLVEQHYPKYLDKVVEPVLHQLFEDPQYPKADAKGKGKRKRDDDDQAEHPVKVKIDYGSKNRKWVGSPHYTKLAWDHLLSDFSDIPTAHVREIWTQNHMFYAPTFLALREHRTLQPLPYKPMSRPRPKGKGKAVDHLDEEFERELRWVQEKLEEDDTKKAAELAEERRLQEEGGIECGCCFSEYPFEKMVQCPEAHLFCMSCMNTYAETKLGEHDMHIVCMDQSGCKLPFPDSELRRFLSPKLLELYERVKQRKEIEAAGLENLEECPFCDYKVVIENENERLFRCENETCGAVTCRQCKKPDHLPKSCQEVADDKKLDVRHAIEEAMTAALMRNCPKCQKAFVKEMGCNKMTCPNCGSLSCYVCRQLIIGYDHFGNPPPYNAKIDPKKCPLWDSSVEGRHSDEVTAAAKAAIEEYKRTHPELDEKDLKVDLPPPAPAAGPSRGGVHRHGHAHIHMPQHELAMLQQFGADMHGQAAFFAPALPALPPLPQLYPPPGPERPPGHRDRMRERRADLVRMWRQQRHEHAEVAAARRHVAVVHRHPPAAPPPAPEPAPVHNVYVHIHHNPPAPLPAPPPAPGPHVWFPMNPGPMQIPLHAQFGLPPPPAPAPMPIPEPPMLPAPMHPMQRGHAHRRSKRARERP
ncbi:hypothetical protein C2E23DRAFT_809859 [Lenzites betulinus]|nr:hypothetical protein C2E23DRAFT_809859 [Lenzites betulinus]